MINDNLSSIYGSNYEYVPLVTLSQNKNQHIKNLLNGINSLGEIKLFVIVLMGI